MNSPVSYAIRQVVPNVRASGLLVSTCSIQEPDGDLVDAGSPSGNYLPVAGLQNIECMGAPESISSIKAGNKKEVERILGQNLLHLWLPGYYPQIQSTPWQAVLDGITWDIVGVETDSQSQQTRLALRIANE